MVCSLPSAYPYFSFDGFELVSIFSKSSGFNFWCSGYPRQWKELGFLSSSVLTLLLKTNIYVNSIYSCASMHAIFMRGFACSFLCEKVSFCCVCKWFSHTGFSCSFLCKRYLSGACAHYFLRCMFVQRGKFLFGMSLRALCLCVCARIKLSSYYDIDFDMDVLIAVTIFGFILWDHPFVSLFGRMPCLINQCNSL